MSKRALFAALTVVALTAISVFFFGKAHARDIYTYDCETIEQRPTQITQYCADGGAYVYDITWDRWGYNGASGKGIYSEKICVPNCAEGTRSESAVEIYLSGIEVIEGRKILRYLSVNTRNGDLLLNGSSYTNWDVAEFAIGMKEFERDG